MKEFITQALVLDKEDLGEADSRVFLYSPEYGKIIAKVKSSKKTLSKLGGHLEPFNLVSARVIDGGRQINSSRSQIVDALLIEKLRPSWALHKLLNFIKETTLEGQPDDHFWQLVRRSLLSDKINYRPLLAVQGFDPKFAICQNCRKDNPTHFSYKDQCFYCNQCLSGSVTSSLLSLLV